MRAALLTSVLGLVATLAGPAAAEPAHDVTHVVQAGHTLEAIAHRYHVTVEAIVEANHLKDTAHLKPGQRLLIPGAKGGGGEAAEGEADGESGRESRRSERKSHGHGTASLETGPEPRGHAHRGVIDMFRLDEEAHVRVHDGVGHIPGGALKAFEHLMRQGTATHAPDARLVALIGIVSDHFGGRPIEVVSGFRAYTPTQYTPHSNHNLGRALDFRIRGVRNEELWAFCRTLRNAGCGYYPNSTFVHLDVRDSKAFWIDRSRPGERPQYDRLGAPADEGASEVPDESSAARGASPGGSSQVTAAPAPGDATQRSGDATQHSESGGSGNASTGGSALPLPTDPASEKSL